MPFNLKIDVPYKARAHHRQAPADIQEFRQSGRWQNRQPMFGSITAYAASSVVIFSLGIGVSSFRLNQVVTAAAYDMNPTGTIKVAPEMAAKTQSCGEQPHGSKSDAAARF